MKTIEVKTSELIGAALDWAVAVAVKHDSIRLDMLFCGEEMVSVLMSSVSTVTHWNPSTDWSQAGPMIEQYKLHLHCDEPSASFLQSGMRIGYTANTVLIAAMRAIVAAKLGDVVNVPVELVEKVK